MWEKYLKDGTGGQALGQDQFIATLRKQVQDPALRQTLAGPLPLFFSAVDANADGMDIENSPFSDDFSYNFAR